MLGKNVGHYTIIAKLGAGGMGDVYLAEDNRLDRKAAIKILPAEMAADPDRRQRFLTEAKAASALNHPHVCVVYDVGETEDGLPFIAMEFVDGESLDVFIKKAPPSKRRRPQGRTGVILTLQDNRRMEASVIRRPGEPQLPSF